MANWGQVLQEIQNEIQLGSFVTNSAVNTVRKKYLQELHGKTGRNIIAYYSGFLSKPQIRSGPISMMKTRMAS